MLFNIFLADLFFILNKIDIAHYADDDNNVSNDNNGLIKSLEEGSKESYKWFDDNLMKRYPDKYHLLVSTSDNVVIKIENFQIENAKRKQLLGIQFQNELALNYHLSEIYKKASAKFYTLGRVTSYMNLSNRKILMDVFINSHSRIINQKNKQTT